MNRRESRICAFELLYEADFHKDEEFSEISERSLFARDIHPSDYARQLFTAAGEHLSDIDGAIDGASEKWKLSRMSAVTRAILRMCVCELLYTDTPAKAAINEAVEIAKLYDEEKAGAFINGILNKVARDVGRITESEEKSE